MKRNYADKESSARKFLHGRKERARIIDQTRATCLSMVVDILARYDVDKLVCDVGSLSISIIL